MNQLGLFAKFWQPGRVKTRLAARAGDEYASRIYRIFLDHLIGHLSKSPPESCDRLSVVFSPPEKREEFARTIGPAWTLVQQSEGDLGNRMSRFFDQALADNENAKAVIIGSDTPHLSSQRIEHAFTELDECDVVFGPSSDGGYYLIGMKQVTAAVFNGIDWSTPAVLEQSLAALEASGRTYGLLPEMTDVDEMNDLQSLISLLERETEIPEGFKLLESIQRLNRELIPGGIGSE